MLRICKIKIVGKNDEEINLSSTDLAINDNYRTVMGYVEESKKLNVKVERVVKPDLTRDTDAELTYVTIAERTFTEQDFLKPTDNMAWVVDFDVTTGTIKDPVDILEYTKQFAAFDSDAHLHVYNYIDKRFNNNLLPLFILEDFYKQSTGFDTAIITYYIDENTIISPTTWTQQNVRPRIAVKEVGFREKNSWNATMRTNVFFEILNEDGTVNTSADIQPSLNIRTDYYDNDLDRPAQEAAKILGNQFSVSLPKSDLYKVRVNYFNMVADKSLSVRYDVRCINGVSSKDRLNSGIKAGQLAPNYEHLGDDIQGFINEISDHLAGNKEDFINFDYSKFAGFDTLNITNSLEVGDEIRLKLDCGSQTSYAELVIRLV